MSRSAPTSIAPGLVPPGHVQASSGASPSCASATSGPRSTRPWTNGKIESFWATLQAEVLDRQQLVDLAAAEAAVTAYAGYYNYHRLHGELDWQTPGERLDGTPFTDRGFASVPALARVAELLDAILAA
jgi:hypothetical protein